MSQWMIKDNGELPYQDDFPELFMLNDGPNLLWKITENSLPVKTVFPELYTINDGPNSLWKIKEGAVPFKSLFEELNPMGACRDAFNLSKVTFPSTLQSIGMYSFANTALTEVTLPENCTYYKTSFPEGCKIKGGKLNG